jgi:hypothetical protein
MRAVEGASQRRRLGAGRGDEPLEQRAGADPGARNATTWRSSAATLSMSIVNLALTAVQQRGRP